MRENRFFVLSTDLSGFAPVTAGGKAAVLEYALLAERVEALCGRDAAALFAEPVLPRGAEELGAAISWYGAREGRAGELTSIDEIARRPAVERLSACLNALAPALRDPEVGPLVAAALAIPSAKSILTVGGQPLLVNWGYLPAGVAADPASRRKHYVETLGRYAPALTELIAPEPSAEPSSAPPVGPFVAAAAARAAEKAPPPPWRAPLIATVLAGLTLLILLLPGVLAYPNVSNDAARAQFETERLKRSNESLEAQIDALQKAAQDKLCRADGGASVVVPGLPPSAPGKEEPAPRMELTPRPPEQAALPPARPGEAPQAQNVAELLEKATVLVIAPSGKKKGVSTGTGFFISDRHIVTNHHVIEDANPQAVLVASKSFSGVRRAHVVAKTEPPPSESEARPDLAVLEVEPIPGVGALRLAGTPPKLSTAYVAGFPGFLVQRDANFAKLIKELEDALGQGDVDQALASRQMPVPGADLRYGRVNNLMSTGPLELPIVIHDMQLAQGNSGGPLVDGCGRLGGVNTMLFPNAKAGYQQGNVAQDVTVLRKFLTEKQIAFTADDAACAPAAGAAPAGETPQSDGSGRK